MPKIKRSRVFQWLSFNGQYRKFNHKTKLVCHPHRIVIKQHSKQIAMVTATTAPATVVKVKLTAVSTLAYDAYKPNFPTPFHKCHTVAHPAEIAACVSILYHLQSTIRISLIKRSKKKTHTKSVTALSLHLASYRCMWVCVCLQRSFFLFGFLFTVIPRK